MNPRIRLFGESETPHFQAGAVGTQNEDRQALPDLRTPAIETLGHLLRETHGFVAAADEEEHAEVRWPSESKEKGLARIEAK